MNWTWIWLIILIIAIIVEVFTVGLTTIWIAGGALLALVLSFFFVPVFLQIAVFFVTTGVLLYFTRPLAVKYLNRRKMRTNVEAVIGREVRVIETVDNRNEKGKVIYNGIEWTARSMNSDEVIPEGEMAEVCEVSGVKLILKKQF